MTLKEIKTQVLSMIEELNPTSEYLTDDPDIQLKINSVINQVQTELARLKKIPAKYVYDVATNGKTLLLSAIPKLYQINKLSTDKYKIEGDLEIVFDDDVEDTVTIYYYKYPELIDVIITPDEPTENGTEETEEVETDITDDTYVFELATDALEVLPYGVAADLLKNDMISDYGKHYYERYNMMMQMLDSKTTSGLVVAEGGLDI